LGKDGGTTLLTLQERFGRSIGKLKRESSGTRGRERGERDMDRKRKRTTEKGRRSVPLKRKTRARGLGIYHNNQVVRGEKGKSEVRPLFGT